MRLGQLARKLEVRPAEIVAFLGQQNIHVDNGTNTRLEANHVMLAMQRFSPGMPVEEAVEDVPDTVVENKDEAVPVDQTPPDNNISDEIYVEKIEVIKAPKIELSGLKVLGKIDLPETRKKDPAPPAENPPAEKPEAERQKEFRKEKRPKEIRRQQRSSKNPIALQREQEALEARKKMEEERRLQKERRTQNYLKKVKAPQPTKPARIFNEETQEMSVSELQEPPKTLWGKFVKWLTT